jgi:phosphate-selective porin OprO/OprP
MKRASTSANPKRLLQPRKYHRVFNGWLALGLMTAAAVHGQVQLPTNVLAVSVQTVKRVEAAQQAQADTLQKLLERIDLLEKKASEQKEAAQSLQRVSEDQQKAYAEREQTLLGKIAGLEGKVGSLEAGRVLPEIALPPDDSLTVNEVDQKIRVVERKGELAAEAAEAKVKEAPKVSVGQNGFSFSSADTNFVLTLRGVVQLDSRTFFNDNSRLNGNDSFLLRRARPVVEGTVFRDFDFQIVPDFGGSSVQLFDAFINYRIRQEVQLRFGKFKGPVGLEQLQSDATLSFNERSLATDLVPIRNLGVQLWGDLIDGALGYAAGVFNSSGDGRNPANNDFNDDKEFAGRVFLRPFKQSNFAGLSGFGFGLGGSYSQVKSNALGLPNNTGGTLPGYATDGQQQFFAYNPVVGTVVADGTHWRLAPQAYLYHGPFGLLGEYVISHQGVRNSATRAKADLENTAWQVSAQWVLTGEPASFTGITPAEPFRIPGSGWGAWQLVARYGQLNIDDRAFQGFSDPNLSANSATAWSVGINWWLNKNVRVLTSFSHTIFDGGGSLNLADPRTLVSPATVTQQDENVLFTRVQLAF